MKSVRLVVFTPLAALSLVVSARSEPQAEKLPTRPNILAGCLKAGEHVALNTSPNGAYHLRVIAPDELDKIRQATKAYPARLTEYESKRKELAEARDKAMQQVESLRKDERGRRIKQFLDAREKARAGGTEATKEAREMMAKLQEGQNSPSPELQTLLAKAHELDNALGTLISPSRPIVPYEVTVAGHDFVAVSDGNDEIAIPWTSVLDVRRKIGPR